ncbi:MAG: glycosyltransferase [Erysipelotrichaceae bacterium]
METTNKKHTVLFFLTVVLMCVYLLWRAFFTIPLHSGLFSFIFGILLLFSEVITTFTTFELFYRRIKKQKSTLLLPTLEEHEYPHVDVLIATHNEDVALLYKTINACMHMEYPDLGKVHIYLCDDSNREEVAVLARDFQIGYLGMEDNKHAKSGNLNNALMYTTSPLVANFDADMIPKRSFLMETVPYFSLPLKKQNDEGVWISREEDEIDPDYKIGFVQTPQSFYNPDLFQFNLFGERSIPNEQDFFSKEINVMRNSSNAVAYTGSNTVIARAALNDIGWFPTNTITEDFQVGIMIQSKGYTTYSTNKPQAAGLSTTTIPSMLTQRIRWARGVIQSVKNTNILFNRGLGAGAKTSYVVCTLYWWSFFNRLIFILSPILFALFDVQIVDTGFWELLFFWLPSYTLYSLSMRYLSSELRNQRWCQIIDTILAPYLIVPVFLETLGFKEKKFKVTNKGKEQQSFFANLKYALPHLLLIVLSIAAIIRFTAGKYGWALFYSGVIIFWLINNLITLLYAIFFLSGRKAYRNSERFDVQVACDVCFDDQVIQTQTSNISEGGLSFVLEEARYIPIQQNLEFKLESEHYTSKFSGKVLYVREKNNKYHYAVQISEIEEYAYKAFLQVIYDRDHTLPKSMDLWVTAADDVTRNVIKRIKPQKGEMRKFPRMQLNHTATFEEGIQGVIKDFNYQYMRIEGVDMDTLTYKDKNLDLTLQLRRMDGEPKHSNLYKVDNFHQICFGSALHDLVVGWQR